MSRIGRQFLHRLISLLSGCLFQGRLFQGCLLPAGPIVARRARAAVMTVVALVAWAGLADGPVAAHAGQGGVLTLDASASRVEAWPAVRVLLDPDRSLGLADVLARRGDFATPVVPQANFGPRPGVSVWLRIPVQALADERWVLEVDYPPLNRIEAWVVSGDRVREHALMGSDIHADQRPVRSRAHVFLLSLEAGPIQEIFLKIDSSSTVVTPVRLHREAAYVAYESRRMLLLGLMFGSAILLIALTTINGISLRDAAFFYYATMLVGISLFFISYSGLGHQFLWSTQTGALEKVSPFGALLALTAASFFVISALEIPQRNPRMARCLQVTAGFALAAIIGSAIGLLNYRQASVAATILGLAQITLALMESIRQARRGSRIAVYMAIGWGAYSIGSLSLALLLRGLMPVDFLTQNLFQFSSLVEMLAWMRVLAIRIEVIRQDAERVAAEKQALHTLAHTDPLTGLLNRRGLVLSMDSALAAARPRFAVYLIDLDGFKAVNDQHGHEAGDETLVQVSQRLKSVLRDNDIIARLGGDEFVVLASNVGSEATAFLIGRKMLDAVRQPMELSDRRQTRVGATIGFALAPEDGAEADALLRAADAAMYAGKSAGRLHVRRASQALAPSA